AAGGHIALVSTLGNINLSASQDVVPVLNAQGQVVGQNTVYTSLDISSVRSSAGSVFMSAPGASGITLSGDIIATASGAAARAGRVVLQAANGPMTLANIDASASDLASGGTVYVTAGATIQAGCAQPDGMGLKGSSVSGDA